jgi:uncharacterized protein YbaP (TraB family)
MRPILSALSGLTTLFLLATPALAACNGQDLMETLTKQEKAAFDAQLAATPYPDGNHWRATRGDEVLHLVGTLHLSDTRLDDPAASLILTITGADLLLLEMTKAEEAQLQHALTARPDMLLLPDTTLPELLPESDWQRLSEAMRLRGMPPFMVAKMRPWYVSMLLSIPPCMVDKMADQNGLDARLERAAVAAGVPTRALEPYDTGFTAFADIPFDTQLLMIRSALSSPDTGEDLFETLLAAYFDEQHAASQIVLEVLSPRLTPLDEDENQQVFDKVGQALIATRNKAWIPVLLDALDQTDGYVVAGFGAAHLAGEVGILNLLAAEGFTLVRQPFGTPHK